MNKLQYDNLYKFFVSLGVILITLPVLALIYISNSEILLISNDEYNSLSEYSVSSLARRSDLINILESVLPWISMIFVALGVFLICLGIYKWYNIQNELDRQLRFETKLKEKNIQKMTPKEIVKKVAEEIDEISEEDNQNAVEKTDTDFRKFLLEYVYIAEKCYKYAVEQYKHDYRLSQNLKIGKNMCDFIAISKSKKHKDIIFEIKYWKGSPSDVMIDDLISRMINTEREYTQNTGRKCESKLIIVGTYITANQLNMIVCKNIGIEYFDFSDLQSL